LAAGRQRGDPLPERLLRRISRRSGIYAVPRFGMTKLLVRTQRRTDYYWMWGG
jgi:hypothetical protein